MSRCLHQRTSILFLALITFLISPVAQHRAQGEDQPTAVTTNDILAEVGARIPEFGGMFVDEENDTLYVYAVGGGQELAASFDAAITAVLGRDRPPQTRLKVLQGRYSFVQLKEWHDRMSTRVLSIPGTVLTEIDQTTNRLKVGVEKLALEPDVLAEVAEL